MARIRTLKPEALQHRKVGRLSDRAFRLWIGMITQADDAGRLVCDPEQLRVVAFAYQPRVTATHVEQALEEILQHDLVRWYQVAGVGYVVFPSWAEHQKIDRPTPSKLPAYEGSTSPRRVLDPSRARADRIGSDRIRSDQDHHGSSPSEDPVGVVSPNGRSDWPSPEALVALYNADTPDECPSVTTLSSARRQKARRSLAQFPDLAFWSTAFREIQASPFLRGLRPSPGHERFIADFDWLLAKGKDGTENVVKVAEGKYRG
jgi:hypothetical protein